MESSDVSAANGDEPAYSAAHGSKLIEFPGVSRSTVPQWRKELSERVREVQEKRAREEALDLSLEKGPDLSETMPQLELLPQAEAAPVNPLVAAALRRIERAHDGRVYAGNSSGSTAVAYAAPMLQDDTAVGEAAPLTAMMCDEEELQPRQPEKAHNLVVVPAPTPAEVANVPKPKRVIRDLDDPALNYLDSVSTTARLETSCYQPASVVARLVSAIVDLAVVALLCAPFAAALELINTNWQLPRAWILAAGIFSIIGFLYFTVSTALTGQTLGLRLFSLRIVDVRTGLIPTGTQSAGRALIYQASLIVLGITSVFALLNPEGLTAHDRITRTAVVHS
ncbi:MAG TPA: RDD family protein [Pyrinomonadaceae bacterium]|nr:RDD family protein [Pyrinomonadaceae bacterium]